MIRVRIVLEALLHDQDVRLHSDVVSFLQRLSGKLAEDAAQDAEMPFKYTLSISTGEKGE